MNTKMTIFSRKENKQIEITEQKLRDGIVCKYFQEFAVSQNKVSVAFNLGLILYRIPELLLLAYQNDNAKSQRTQHDLETLDILLGVIGDCLDVEDFTESDLIEITDRKVDEFLEDDDIIILNMN